MAINTKRVSEGLAAERAEAQKAGRGFAPGQSRTAVALREAFKDPAERQNFSFGKAWAELFGWNEFIGIRADMQRSAVKVMEAAGATSYDAFLTINQQFIYSTMIEKYELPEFQFSRKIPSRQSPFVYERVPGVSNIGDEATVVGEGKEFPLAGPTEDYRETPDTVKRGLRVAVTKEAVFFDRTGLVTQRCAEVAEWLGLNKEKRAIDAFIDAGETTTFQYRYRWRGVSTNSKIVAIATYGDSSGDHNWDNLAASNPLTDFESINTAWQLLLAMTDPYTGEPIGDMLQPKDVVFPPSLAFKFPFTVAGTIKKANPGFASSGNPNTTEIENPVQKLVGTLSPMFSQLLQARMTAAGIAANTWWLGDLAKLIECLENWPLTVLTLGAGSQEEFTHDIVAQYRASERSTFSVKQPRAMIKNTP